MACGIVLILTLCVCSADCVQLAEKGLHTITQPKKIQQVRSQQETTDVQAYITPANFQRILMHVLVAWMRLFCVRKGVTAALTLYAAPAPNPSTHSGLCHKKNSGCPTTCNNCVELRHAFFFVFARVSAIYVVQAALQQPAASLLRLCCTTTPKKLRLRQIFGANGAIFNLYFVGIKMLVRGARQLRLRPDP